MKLDSSLSSFRAALLGAGQPCGAPREGLVAPSTARDDWALGLEALDAEGLLPSFTGVLGGSSLVNRVRLAIIEGCVGKTIAALEAAEALERASDQATIAALGWVREDEACRAELAWRFVARAIEVGGEAVRETAAEAFAGAFDEAAGETLSTPSDEAEADIEEGDDLAAAFGFLSERQRSELRRRALCDVVGPCAEQMLAASLDQGAERHDTAGEEDGPASGVHGW